MTGALRPPPDPDFEARVRRSFAQQRAMGLLGASLTAVEAGRVTAELPFRDDLTQQHGYLHAGIVTALMDSACGYAAYTLMPAGAEVLSAEFKVNLLAPARGERLVARGRVVKAGRTLTVCEGEGAVVRDGEEHLVAVMLATMIRLDPR